MLYEEPTNNCKNISGCFEQIREILEHMISNMSDEEIKKIKNKYEGENIGFGLFYFELCLTFYLLEVF